MVDHDATAKMTTTPTEAIVYDKDGDLTLCVGFTETFYQVCPQSLRRSSPVFGRMLFGKFAESRPTVGQWVVDLPDDDNEAMEIFLGMVHSRFEMVPNTLSIAKLYALLTLTNKYDATALVRPWARSWIDAVKKGETWDYRLLGIAWEVGDDYLFREMVWLMVWNSVVGSDGWLRFGSKQQLLSVDMPIEPGNDVGIDPYSLEHFIYLRPTGTIETIEAARKSMVEAALKPR
ncbi:nuclear pore protein-like protein [Colletotrichum asianum]